MNDTLELLRDTDFPQLKRAGLETLQVNLGYLCNQQCLHCHVDASPRRVEIMSADTIEQIQQFMISNHIKTLDLTGGAPEMNPHFQTLVSAARQNGIHVIDRCNLTILMEPGYEWLAQFLYDNEVEVVASLPCYLEQNVDAQRGKGVYDKSILGMQRLNALGYGRGERELNLVFNPQGANLPPDQVQLEADYKRELDARFSLSFDHLYTIANMPIKRFGSMLVSKGEFENYMSVLKGSHQSQNVSNVMCRTMISVDWQGYIYDCDFNQMLGLNAGHADQKTHISDVMSVEMKGEPIVVMDHCYGCTAGQGSSCGGALG